MTAMGGLSGLCYSDRMNKLYYVILVVFGIIGVFSAAQAVITIIALPMYWEAIGIANIISGTLIAIGGILALMLFFARHKNDPKAIRLRRLIGKVLGYAVIPLTIVMLLVSLSQTSFIQSAYCNLEQVPGSGSGGLGVLGYQDELSVEYVCNIATFDISRIAMSADHTEAVPISYELLATYGGTVIVLVAVATMVLAQTRNLANTPQTKR